MLLVTESLNFDSSANSIPILNQAFQEDTAHLLTLVKKIQIDPRGSAGGSDGVNFNRSGSIAAVANDKGECILFDVTTWKEVLKVVHYKGKVKDFDDQQINNISFSFDDSLFATGMNNTGVKIWETKSGKLIKRLVDGTSSDGLAFSPCGKWIAVASNNKAVVFALPEYIEVFSTDFARGKECNTIDWTPDSKYLLAAGDSRIKIISTIDWTVANTINVGTGSVKSIRVNPTGDMVIGTGNIGIYTGTVRIYTIPDGNKVADLPAYSPAKVISGDDDDGDTPNVEDACWTHDGAYIFSGGPYDGVIRIYRVKDWSFIGWKQGQEFNRQIEAIDCNKNGLLLTTGDDGFLHIHRFKTPNPPIVNSLQSTSNALISVEAENYTSKTDMGDFFWKLTSDKKASENYSLRALPLKPNFEFKDYLQYDPVNDAPKIDYIIDFKTSGKYFIWVRLKGNNKTNSVNLSIDDKVVTTLEGMSAQNSKKQWVWTNRSIANAVSYFTISTAGHHTLNLRMKKSGTEIDKIIITTDSNFIPKTLGTNGN